MLHPKIIFGLIRKAFWVKAGGAIGIFAGVLYAGFYLFATGIVAYYPDKDISKYTTVPYIRVLLYDQQGWSPSYPWIISYPTNHIVISLPFWALLSTILLAFLLACNVALVGYMIFNKEASNRRALGTGIFGV